eukprot:2461069-Alexandrium_andersonii.AAC.1
MPPRSALATHIGATHALTGTLMQLVQAVAQTPLPDEKIHAMLFDMAKATVREQLPVEWDGLLNFLQGASHGLGVGGGGVGGVGLCFRWNATGQACWSGWG